MMRVRNEQRRKYMGSEKFSWDEMLIAIRDPKLMFSSVIQFCQDILLYGFSTFLPTILGGMGYDSLMSNVLTVPVYVWAAMVFIAIAWCSDRYSKFASVGLALTVSSPSTLTFHSTSSRLISSALSVTSYCSRSRTPLSSTLPLSSSVSLPIRLLVSTSPG
jgi:hypothetical protein